MQNNKNKQPTSPSKQNKSITHGDGHSKTEKRGLTPSTPSNPPLPPPRKK